MMIMIKKKKKLIFSDDRIRTTIGNSWGSKMKTANKRSFNY